MFAAGGSQFVREISVEEAQTVYNGMCDLSNKHDTLLVVYAPWCKYCKTIEAEVSAILHWVATWQSLCV